MSMTTEKAPRSKKSAARAAGPLTRIESHRARARGVHLLQHLGDPENYDWQLSPDEAAAQTDVHAYATALWSPDSPAYPLDTFSLPSCFESFQAMRPYLVRRKGDPRPPFPLARAKITQPARRRAVLTLGEQLLPQRAMLQALAMSHGVTVGWRGRSLIEQVVRDVRGQSVGVYDHYQVMVPHWPEIADLILARPSRLAIALSNARGHVSIGLQFGASAIECTLFGTAENVRRDTFMDLLDISMALDAAGGKLEVVQSCTKDFHLRARMPIPEIIEEPTALGRSRLGVTVDALARETGARPQVSKSQINGEMVRVARARRSSRASDRLVASLSVADQRLVEKARVEAIELIKSGGGISVDALARRMGLSGRALQRRLRAVGLRFKADIAIPACLDRAADLLRHGHQVQVAMRKVGYTDRSRFAQVFKERFGMLPSVYCDRARGPR